MPTNQRSVAEGRAQAVACLGEVHECLSRFLKNLGGIDPATAEDLVEVIGTELGEMGQQFIKTFSGALQQGRDAIAGPQSLAELAPQRQADPIQSQPDEQSAAADLLARIGAH
jgi:hypothetical protein